MSFARKFGLAMLAVLALALGGCRTADQNALEKMKFERLFCWGRPINEAVAER